MARRRKNRRPPSKPKVQTRYKTRTITRYRNPAPAPKKKRRTGAVARRRSSTARTVVGATSAVVGGAVLGSLANEAGLLMAVPAQNKTGISLVGWTGLGLTLIGLFTKSEGGKMLTYGVGGGMMTTELVRQIDNRGYDFRVAMGKAPALDYSHKDPVGQLPALQPAPALAGPAQAPAPQQQTPTQQAQPKSNSIPELSPSELDSVKFFMLNGASFERAVKETIAQRTVASNGVSSDGILSGLQYV